MIDLPLGPERLKRLLQGRQFATLEEAQAAVADLMRDYNDAPQDELDGASPNLMAALFRKPAKGGPLRLDPAAAAPEAVDGAQVLRNLWRVVDVADGAKLTAARYLPPAVVRRILEGWSWGHPDLPIAPPGAIREMEFPDLLFVRSLALAMGLLRVERGRVVAPPRKRAAFAKRAPAAQFDRAFRAAFLEWDLGDLTRIDDLREVQPWVPWVLWRLSALGDGSAQAGAVLDALLPPALRDAPEETVMQYRILLLIGIVTPLQHFGLLRGVIAPGMARGDPLAAHFALTPLFRQYVGFDTACRPAAIGARQDHA
jgi:hypothetical protein